jgi:hypothetical protein
VTPKSLHDKRLAMDPLCASAHGPLRPVSRAMGSTAKDNDKDFMNESLKSATNTLIKPARAAKMLFWDDSPVYCRMTSPAF